ncbi:2Fe-2S iron-sulfur cluster binding domain-containing protein [Burkholderiaceae bacterium DAT-1]|nr:2Fe-2S iron-sulfur cluster binding domain-containing protein [Burkholderiaceae bacterium DAT-1]
MLSMPVYSSVKFVSPRLQSELEAKAETESLLIDLIRPLVIEGQLPLYWRCGHGTCGACLVYIEHAGSGHAAMQYSGKEYNVLKRQNRIAPDMASNHPCADTATLPRLACHVRIPAGDVVVKFD